MGDGDDRSGAEHRQHRRFPVDWRLTLRVPSWGVELQVAALNASRGGLFVLTSRPPPAGTPVELDIELPDGAHTRLVGTVQHIVTPERALADGRSPGIGVRVDEKHAVDLMLLEEMAMAADAGPAPRFEPSVLTRRRAPVVPVGRVQVVGVAAARVVGVELGASMARLGCAVGDRISLATGEDGRHGVPAVAAFPAGEAPVAGWAAYDRLESDPRRTVSRVKGLLGRRLEDAADVLPSLSFPAVAGADGDIHVDLGGVTVPVVEAAAAILLHVRDLGERSLRRAVRAAVLSCSAAAGPAERETLRRAADLAGIDALELVEEPVAAARAYGAGRDGPELCGVYDWGGGRFTFSVVEIAGARARVIETEEDHHLAGEDVDEALADDLADRFWRETKVELRQSIALWRRLISTCEEAKRALSLESTATVKMRDIVVAEPDLRVDLEYRVERAELEAVAEPLVRRSLALCGRVLERCGLGPAGLSRFLAVGGISYMPLVRREVAALAGRALDGSVPPDEAVVAGLARAAATRGA